MFRNLTKAGLVNFTEPDDIIKYLNLSRCPSENIWFNIFNHDIEKRCLNCSKPCKQANSTSVISLYKRQEKTPWFNVDLLMSFNYLAGAPMKIEIGSQKKINTSMVLGNDFTAGNLPVKLVPQNKWRRLTTMGNWSLISYIYSPGFEFSHLKVAEIDWLPGLGKPKLMFPGEKWTPNS